MNVTVVPPMKKAQEFVSWYRSKFVNGYGPNHWTTIDVDQSAFVQVAMEYSCESFLEIGTWEGYTGLLLWLCPGMKRGAAMDICQNFVGGGDTYHHDITSYGKYFYKTTPVDLLVTNSTTYIPKPEDRFDLVVIDGNHDYEYVKSDFQLARKMANKAIAFHDYDNGNPGVDKFLAELSAEMEIRHFEGSAVVCVEIGKK